MGRTLFAFIGFIALLGAVFIFLTGEMGKGFRDNLAYKMSENGQFAMAEKLYSISAAGGDLTASNNLAVLQYHRLRYDSDCDCDNWKDAGEKFMPVFEDLARKGHMVSAYNRGMFDFACSSHKRCYETGKHFFGQAAGAGDPLAVSALAVHYTTKSSHEDSREKNKMLMAAADAGDPYAAYVLASDMKNKNDARALRYADIAAKGGASYAQELRGHFFDQPDFMTWLAEAAENPKNPRASAASLLGHLYLQGERGVPQDFQKAKYWYEKAVQTDGKHRHVVDIRKDGFRWRAPDRGYIKNSSQSYHAAYKLATLEYMGVGGKRDLKKFEKLMRHAAKDDIHDSRLILMQLEQKRNPMDQERFDRRQAQWVSEHLGKRKDRLVPLIARKVDAGKLRFVSFLEIADWVENGQLSKPVSGHDHYLRFRENPHDFIFQETFYVDEPLNLPADMYGQQSGNFIFAPGLSVPKKRNHNTIYQLKRS